MLLTVDQIIQIKCSDLHSDDNKNLWVQLAEEQTDRCYFGNDYNKAVALRACHEYALNNRPGGSSGAPGVLNSIKEGDLSISFGISGDNSLDGDLNQTMYGKQLLSLIYENGVGISVTGTNTIVCED